MQNLGGSPSLMQSALLQLLRHGPGVPVVSGCDLDDIDMAVRNLLEINKRLRTPCRITADMLAAAVDTNRKRGLRELVPYPPMPDERIDVGVSDMLRLELSLHGEQLRYWSIIGGHLDDVKSEITKGVAQTLGYADL